MNDNDMIGSIEMFAFKDIPNNWAACDGQIVPIHKMQSLHSMIGNRYGGDGITTFALPDLRGRVPVGAFHPSNPQKPLEKGLTQRKLGEKGGEAYHQLNGSELPIHKHSLHVVSDLATEQVPTTDSAIANPSYFLGREITASFGFTDKGGEAVMKNASLGKVGGTPHLNMQPYVGVQYCICFYGQYPERR